MKAVTPPLQAPCLDVLLKKYANAEEDSVEDIQKRVAIALATGELDYSLDPDTISMVVKQFVVDTQTDEWEGPGISLLDSRTLFSAARQYYRTLKLGFFPGGRINAAAGTNRASTWINCFTQPVADTSRGTIDGAPGILDALGEAHETLRHGGGEGYNFSRLRPLDACVKSNNTLASGPLPYMDVFDQMCKTVISAGARRGAQMAVLNVEHPDIDAFIRAKRTDGRFTQFNLSVGISDSFMQAVEADQEIALVHEAEPGKHLIDAGAKQREDGMWIYKTVRARELYETIMRSTYEYSDPGVLFLDQINRQNNLGFCEKIEATNPYDMRPAGSNPAWKNRP